MPDPTGSPLPTSGIKAVALGDALDDFCQHSRRVQSCYWHAGSLPMRMYTAYLEALAARAFDPTRSDTVLRFPLRLSFAGSSRWTTVPSS